MTVPAGEIGASARRRWAPPPRTRLSEWADAEFYLAAQSSANPGKWRTQPAQREILDAMGDPTIERVSVMKSTRVGCTKMAVAAMLSKVANDPCPMMIMLPTQDGATKWSLEELAPTIAVCPSVAELVEEAASRSSANKTLFKMFPGGAMSIVGANSPANLRQVSRRLLICDEVDAYPQSAGTEGDPIALAEQRTADYWDRKLIFISTPLLAGTSHIERLYLEGDQRRYYVPCPVCGHMDFFTFREHSKEEEEDERGRRGAGHFMRWPEGRPEDAHFVCRARGCRIDERHKVEMMEGGEWRAAAPFRGHASFHIWRAYSFSPNARWGQVATEFVKANRGGPEKLKTFVNTALAEAFHERGEAPDWERIHQRRESYKIGTVPDGVIFLTAGVDVQRNRLVYDVVGWGANRESWGIECGELLGDPSAEEVWKELDALKDRKWLNAAGVEFGIVKMGVDSGDQTQEVYNYCRTRSPQVYATKGVGTASVLIGAAKPVDVTWKGKRYARGCLMWPLGVNVAKVEFVGWLKMRAPREGEEFPAGWCHFPEYPEEYFKQITAEQLVTIRHRRTNRVTREWQIIPGRQNHWLDCRIIARAMAALAGLERHVSVRSRKPARAAAPGKVEETIGKAEKATPNRAQGAPPPRQRGRPERDWLESGRRGSGRWL